VNLGRFQLPGLYTGDCRRLLEEIPEESVQCCVTSPPYWGLRVYAGEQAVVWGGDDDCDHDWDETERLSNQGGADPGRSAIVGATRAGVQRGMVTEATCSRCGAWRGGFGNEPTPELYVEHTIEIMEAIRRVLRPDGVLFWNIADSYISSNYGCYAAGGTDGGREIGTEGYVPAGYTPPTRRPHPQIPRKSLALIPARIALAAQAAGWVVRMDIIWAKGASFGPYHGNVMPESVQDRPTRAHEYVFMFTKSPQYYWDPDAVMEGRGVRCPGPAEQLVLEGHPRDRGEAEPAVGLDLADQALQAGPLRCVPPGDPRNVYPRGHPTEELLVLRGAMEAGGREDPDGEATWGEVRELRRAHHGLSERQHGGASPPADEGLGAHVRVRRRHPPRHCTRSVLRVWDDLCRGRGPRSAVAGIRYQRGVPGSPARAHGPGEHGGWPRGGNRVRRGDARQQGADLS